jgi:SpoVK/Ycf46/Vps4 family AAA+-type ATPase
MGGLKLEPTEFSDDKLLNEFIHTQNISDKINCFFTKLHVYAKHGIAVPKRAMLLYGPAGTGKTSASLKVAKDYVKDGKTAVIVWATDKIDPYEVKDFFKSFEYIGVEKIILIMEDIGGVEADQVRMKSTSSLLSLLDNQEKAFKIATFIIATTNHPENFLGNLTNRPGRFDDKVAVDFPSGEERSALLKFFMTDTPDDGVLETIKHKKYTEFSPAHLKEVVIRADLYGKTLVETVEQIQKEIDLFKKAFEKNKGKLGIEPDYE